MVQSPSWETKWSAASQEIPRISRNPKVHYRTHKRPSLVSILGQPNPVHIPTSHLLEIHPNIIHPTTPRSPQWSLSLRLPQQDPNTPLSSPIRAACPAHLILLHFITRTILGEEHKSFAECWIILEVSCLWETSNFIQYICIYCIALTMGQYHTIMCQHAVIYDRIISVLPQKAQTAQAFKKPY